MKKKSVLDNNSVLVVLSLLAAAAIWMTVAYTVESNIPAVIRNVPVTLDTEDSSLTRLDLYPVTDAEFTVDIEVFGARASVGNVRANELSIKAKLNNVTGPGVYDLPLEITDLRNRGLEIKSVTPETISMRFDHQVVKTMDVELDIEGLNIPDGYILDEEYLFPEEVTVTGPATEMEAVQSAGVTLSLDKPISSTTTYDMAIELYDEDDAVVESPYFVYDNRTVTVTLPVLKKKTVPVTFSYVNVPEGFDIDSIPYVLNPEELEVAGPAEALSSLNEVHLGYVDMRDFAPDIDLFYRLSLPPGFISVEGYDELNLRFIPDNFVERELSVENENIYLLNVPEEYEVTVQSRTIAGISVYGPTGVVEELTAKDLVAQIDMNDTDLRLGQSTVLVEVLIPGSNTCWVYGDRYTARITVRERTADEMQ